MRGLHRLSMPEQATPQNHHPGKVPHSCRWSGHWSSACAQHVPAGYLSDRVLLPVAPSPSLPFPLDGTLVVTDLAKHSPDAVNDPACNPPLEHPIDPAIMREVARQ